MNHDRLRRLRAYYLAATSTMEQIPAPVPPEPDPALGPPPGWDGMTIDTSAMYRTLAALPADARAQARVSHALCEAALAWQQGAAERALLARETLKSDVVHGTELGDLVDRLAALPVVQAYQELMLGGADVDVDVEDEDDEETGEVLLADVRRELADYVRRLEAEHGAASAEPEQTVPEQTKPEQAADPAVAVAVESPEPARDTARPRMVRAWAASATVVAALCALLLIWQHLATPASVAIRPINQAIQAGDMTAIVSYSRRTRDTTEVHVQVVNFGAEPAPALLSLGKDDSDPAGPIMVPARSTQHRVLRVRKDRKPSKRMGIQFQKEESVVIMTE